MLNVWSIHLRVHLRSFGCKCRWIHHTYPYTKHLGMYYSCHEHPWLSMTSSKKIWFLAFSASNPSNVHSSPCNLGPQNATVEKKQNFAKRRSTLDTFWPALWKKNTFSFKTAQIRRRQPKKKEKHQHDAQFETVPIPPIPQIPPHCPTTQNQPRNLETAPSSKVFFEDVWHPKQWRDSRNFGPTSSGCGPSISIPGDSEAEWFHGNLNTMLFGGDWIPSSSETMTMDWFGIGKGPILRSFSWHVAVTCTYR